MPIKRLAGTVKLNSVSYKIVKDGDSLVYNRKSVPKIDPKTGAGGASAGQSNMVEYAWPIDAGFGDSDQTRGRNLYHHSMNLFMEHESEAVFLPTPSYSKQSGVAAYDLFKPPVGVFELVTDGDQPEAQSTYWLQDCQCLQITSSSPPTFNYTINKTFEAGTEPSDVVVFNNIAYIAMGSNFDRVPITSVANDGASNPRFATPVAHNLLAGDLIRIDNSTQAAYNGIWVIDSVSDSTHFDVDNLTYTALSPDLPVTAVVYKINRRYLRKFDGNTWSRDDNTYKAVTAVANNAGTTRISVTAHGYSVGDYVYFVNMDRAAYNSMSTTGNSVLYQVTSIVDANTFDSNMTFSVGTAIGFVNRQDSDVHAEHLAIVGDLMVRGYKDSDGWKTSRVDIIGSNPMLDANWTAGIGTVSVGDADSPITDLIAVGDGELVCKAEGGFIFRPGQGAYLNEIPELEEHRHPRNGRGSFEWKGWVYIPTVVGIFRWRPGQVSNVTPGRGGQQSFLSPVSPIGAFTGDTERLYGIFEPFKVNQPKNVVSPTTRIYLDASNTGVAEGVFDFGLDPTFDLNGFASGGYLYLGSSQPWHRMYVEVDAINNSLRHSLSGLYVDSAQYWNGSSWIDRAPLIDYTRVRNTSAKDPSSMGQPGDLLFTGPVPTDWAVGGTVGGAQGSVNSGFYWCRFSFNAAISNSVIIKRTIAGIHHAASTFNAFPGSLDMALEHGGTQFVMSMQEEQGRGVVWDTMWAWQQPETTRVDGTNQFTVGGAQPSGAVAIVQPNNMRAGNTGSRWLFVGGHHVNYLCPLGHNPDPTEDGPYMAIIEDTGTNGIDSNKRGVLTFPDTDCGIAGEDKVLQEIDMELEGLAATDIAAYYRVDGGAWTSVGAITAFPHKFTAGSEPSGNKFALAVVATPTDGNYVRLPRFSVIPSMRVFVRPSMAEIITMTVELHPEQILPGQTDRRASKTAYAALRNLQSNTVSIPFVDVDQGAENVHIMQVSKRVLHNAEEEPKIVADIILSVVP